MLLLYIFRFTEKNFPVEYKPYKNEIFADVLTLPSVGF